MYVVFVAVAAVVVFAVAAAAVGRGDGLEEPFPDMEHPYLPDGRVEASDIDDVHFAVSFRGYRMEQVDSVLDRLAGQLVERDRHITRLERMVQNQARQSAMAYTPPRGRVGLDPGMPQPDAGAETAEEQPGGGATGGRPGSAAAGPADDDAESTVEWPAEAEEPQQTGKTPERDDRPQRNGTRRR
ncbi:MAG: DivIVA domain-containing protein [Actinomycetota bacterium]